MKKENNKVGQKLLKIRAIKLQPTQPFTWASGWKSPIYCDNRKTLSYPEVRTFIKKEFCKIVKEKYPEAEVIAGVATGAIAIGALVADELGLPFIYVRSAPKGHGLENLVEGDLKLKQKVVVIEDLISTGGSSLKAVDAIRNNGSTVLGMAAIFTYNFPIAADEFKKNKVKLTTLCDYNTLLEVALETDYISKKEVTTLQEWRKSPSTWDIE